jgi:hypothetical protein
VTATGGNVVADGELWWFEKLMCGLLVVGVCDSWQSNCVRAKLKFGLLVVVVDGFPVSWQTNCGSKDGLG